MKTESMESLRRAVKVLEAPIGFGGNNSEDSFEKYDPDDLAVAELLRQVLEDEEVEPGPLEPTELTEFLGAITSLVDGASSHDDVKVSEAIDVIAAMDQNANPVNTVMEFCRWFLEIRAIAENDFMDTRLVSAGPGDGGWEMELAKGPIPYIAEYLAQMLHMDTENSLNFVSMEVNHGKYGTMELTIQRKNGKTPSNLLMEAKALLWRAEKSVTEFAVEQEIIDFLGDYVPPGG